MSDVKNHSPYLSYNAIVPDFLDESSQEPHSFHRDPRADHSAAITRLMEDSHDLPVMKASNNGLSPKPILKRKEAQIHAKPKKRVRFDSEYKDDQDESFEEPRDLPMVPQSMETGEDSKVEISAKPEESPMVPDYLSNPSKYTRYTLEDTSENSNEETNRQAFEDLHRLVNRSKSVSLEPEFLVEPPKSVTFTPRKKSMDIAPMDDSSSDQKKNWQGLSGAVGISVGGATNEGDACEMDKDETADLPLVSDMNMNLRSGRQYRSKSS